MAIKAIIFDMDGVLINSEPIYENSAINMLNEEYGNNVTLSSVNNFRDYKGLKEDEVTGKLIKEFSINDSFDNVKKKRKDYFYKLAKEKGLNLKGANKKLKELNKDYDLAITTSTSGELFEFSSSFIDTQLFKNIITGNDVKNGKPHPEGYLKTIKELKLDPDKCIIVEDALNGVQAGKAAGAKVIGVLGSFTKKQLIESGADLILPDMTHITKETIEGLQ